MSPLSRDVTPPGDEPRSPLEQAADKALATLEHWLAADQLELQNALLIVDVSNLPDDRNAVTAGRGFEDSRDLIVVLLAHAEAAAKAHGLNLQVHPIMLGQDQ